MTTRISTRQAQKMGMGKKRSKYGAVRCELDGIKFDSKAEMNYYASLKVREKAGEVSAVDVHPRFALIVAMTGVVGHYEADFAFWDHVEDRFRVIDVKGKDTPLSKWKRKHFRLQYATEAEIVK